MEETNIEPKRTQFKIQQRKSGKDYEEDTYQMQLLIKENKIS